MPLHPHFRQIICSLALGAALPALAGLPVDTIKRKGGLWEVNNSVSGMQGANEVVHVCVDEQSDDLQRQLSTQNTSGAKCKVENSRRTEDGIQITSVCKMRGSTITTQTNLSGKFDSAYHGEIKIRSNPPLAGVKESRVMLDAKWVGACRPGQKPGDLILSNGSVVNANGVPQKPSK